MDSTLRGVMELETAEDLSLDGGTSFSGESVVNR